MSSEFVEIQPQILRFTFELKKQSTCLIQLTNKTEQYVAFKVKTTSPKKYCVKPNVGVIKQRGTSDFTESAVLLPVSVVQKQDLSSDTSTQKDKTAGGAEILPPSYKDGEGFQSAKNTEEIRFTKDAEARPDEDTHELRMAKNVDSREFGKVDDENIPTTGMGLKLTNEVDDLSLKLNDLGSTLASAEETVAQLTEERSRAMHEKEMLEQALELARRQNIVKRVYVGYWVTHFSMYVWLEFAV